MRRPVPPRDPGSSLTSLPLHPPSPSWNTGPRRAAPRPAQVAFESSAVSWAREAVSSRCVPLQVCPRPGGPPAALLLGIVNPAVLGGSLLPAQGQLVLAVRVVQARVAQRCHGCRRGAGSLALLTARCRVSRPGTYSSFHRAPRASQPETARACVLRLPEPLHGLGSCNPVSVVSLLA